MAPRQPLDTVLDLGHLDRQTFGDRALARELLVLFDRQCARLAPLMTEPEPGTCREAAHTLLGAARAVGAVDLTALAARIEELPGSVPPAELAAALDAVRKAIGAAATGFLAERDGSALAKRDRVA